MSPTRVFALTLLAMLAFAGNSLLCRMALKHTTIDPASFTSIRIVSGAVVLWLIAKLRAGPQGLLGSWPSALALFGYASAFSFSYVSVTAATGALLLFGAVQATMVGYGLWTGERLGGRQTLGLLLALGGLVGLLLPGLSSPPVQGSVLMLLAGVAWGVYTLRGKGSGDPLRVTAGNFMRGVVPAIALSAAMLPFASLDASGVGFAVASGALASGVGYAIWYTALPGLKVTSAATAQLSVPVIAAVGGVVLLDEPLSLRLVVTSMAILGGIALVIIDGRTAGRTSSARRAD
jgi:drug/metabolite transporter (DMT)-like permease